MNLFSLDTSTRRVPGPLTSRPEVLYACDTLAKPILHDTIIELKITREIFYKDLCGQQSLSNLLLDEDDDDPMSGSQNYQETENIEVSGVVVNALKLSLTRAQYEQLLDTMQWLTISEERFDATASKNPMSTLADITEEDTGVTTLNMDPQVRAKLFSNVPITRQTKIDKGFVSAKGKNSIRKMLLLHVKYMNFQLFLNYPILQLSFVAIHQLGSKGWWTCRFVTLI